MRIRDAALKMLLLAATLMAAGAQAEGPPSAAEWPVERNAQLLAHREWKVGLWGFDGGIVDRVQVGTLWWSWPLAGPNVHLKGLLLDHGPYHLSVETSFLYLNLERLAWFGADDMRGSLSALPVELHFDAQPHPRILLGVSAGYAFSHTSPAYNPRNLEGAGYYDSLLLHGHLTARATKRLWVVAELDWVLHQSAGAGGSVHRHANADVSPLDPASGGAVTASMVVRQRRFGMRLGVGYGNRVLPRLRLTAPRALPFFSLDLFARFGGEADAGEP